LDSPRGAKTIEKGKALLSASRAAPVDCVNVHWYVGDPRALEEAVGDLETQTGLAVLTNEVGQTSEVRGERRACRLRLCSRNPSPRGLQPRGVGGGS